MKKFLWIGIAVMGTLTACGAADETAEVAAPVAEVAAPVAEVAAPVTASASGSAVRDLKGREVTLANWANVPEPENKGSAQEESLWEYRNEMMEKHNFTFAEVGVTTWDGTLEYFSSNTLSGHPKDDIYRIHSSFVSGLLHSGLAYDLASLTSIDLDDPKWNQLAIDYMTKDGAVYGIAKTQRPSFGVFYNKRLFEEAGLDPDLPYDLQASGDWTWEKFEELSELLARDTDADGINDIYALPYSGTIFQYAALSNGGSYVGRDENGMLYNNTLSPETLEGIQWVADYLAKDYELLTTKNMGHTQSFMDGQVAMYVAAESVCVQLNKGMTDEYGFVFFPKGPKLDKYVTTNNPHFWVIPSAFSKEEAEDAAFALDMWASQPPDYRGKDDWMAELFPLYRDDRAVEETIAKMRQTEHIAIDYANFISGNVKIADYTNDVYFGGNTPTEALETIAGIWQAEIDRVNALNK